MIDFNSMSTSNIQTLSAVFVSVSLGYLTLLAFFSIRITIKGRTYYESHDILRHFTLRKILLVTFLMIGMLAVGQSAGRYWLKSISAFTAAHTLVTDFKVITLRLPDSNEMLAERFELPKYSHTRNDDLENFTWFVQTKFNVDASTLTWQEVLLLSEDVIREVER